ncbi:chemotaxis protein CheA [Prochlorothrix hollandica PCC 9006 = CALU 1027]|uniref:histidine kinase n=2 Tax=Prochlorothrix hollandica TaxID=1223 RepID=A0A0M2PZI6_PROHO|nr:chemotaxis protein CheA [Prochlorothrix hollandica PCC 9006 = CALU 1027]
MWIDDDELRDLFKTSSEERLQNIDAGLLHLEKQPDDETVIDAIMRDAHSLKGDSNMLGLKDIGTLAHQVEHILKAVQDKSQAMTPDLCDRLSHALAAMAQMVQESVTGEACGVNTFYVLAELMGASDPPAVPEAIPPSTPPLNGEVGTIEELPVELPVEVEAEPRISGSQDADIPQEPLDPSLNGNGTVPQPTPTPASITLETKPASPPKPSESVDEGEGLALATPGQRAYHIETIRVPTQNLDSLMTHAGELTVTKIRVAHRLAEIESITTLWEEWNRDFFVNRFLFDESKKGGQQGQQLQTFYNRAESYLQKLGTVSDRLRSALYEDITRLEMISDELEEGIRTLRLLPLSTLFSFFPRMVRDLARQEQKQVELVIEGGETQADKRILEEMRDPLMHMIRNAIDHGVELPARRRQAGKPETATITLRSYKTPSSIVIEVEDDGKGLDTDAIKETAMRRGLLRGEDIDTLTEGQIQNLILQPGFSTCSMVTEISGRGVGLDVLQTNVERLKGRIEVESTPGQGCLLRVSLGTTLTTAHVMIVAIQGRNYAIPVEYVQTAYLVAPGDIFTIEGRETIVYDQQPVSVAKLADLLEISGSGLSSGQKQQRMPCIIVRAGTDRLGLFVDDLVDEQDVVLKPQSQLLKRVRNISGATILGTGDVCMVLNPQDLIQSVRRKRGTLTTPIAPTSSTQQHNTILLVEDSIATRTQEKRILEAAGYGVITAVDGLDGFHKLQNHPIDAVVSDVQMPNLDGLGLTARIRQHQEYNEIPVILVTTLASDDDRRRGAEAGANAYITKGSFSQDLLLDTLQRLI